MENSGLENSGFEIRQGQEIFLFSKKPIAGIWLTQPSSQMVLGSLSSRIKRPGREADNSPPFPPHPVCPYLFTLTDLINPGYGTCRRPVTSI